MNRKTQLLVIWFILAIIVTGLVGFPTVGLQQAYRNNANDPQIEVTQEIAAAISRGIPRDQIIGGGGTVDIKNSLSMFVALYDENGKIIGSSGKLNDTDPTPPSNVFEQAKKKNQVRLTWQPENNVRIATVVQTIKAGDKDTYILAGRSLREVENRVKQLYKLALLAWIGLLALSAILTWLLATLLKSAGNSIIQENTEVVIVEETAEKKE